MRMQKMKGIVFTIVVMSFLSIVIMGQKPDEIRAISPWAGSSNVKGNVYRIGNVGIGTSKTGSFKLAVEGKIGAREIIVQNEAWADFVFDEQYQLTPLLKLEEFYKANKHLPGVPDAEHVKNNGVNLGEMQVKLLQKVEELTLYMVELKKENDLLKRRIELLEK